jgi:hypothetical protein
MSTYTLDAATREITDYRVIQRAANVELCRLQGQCAGCRVRPNNPYNLDGAVKLTHPKAITGYRDGRVMPHSFLRGYCRAGDVLPSLESLGHFQAVCTNGEEVASGTEMRRNGTIRGEKTLGMPWRFEPLHAPLPLAGRLVRILRTVVQIPVLTMFHTRHHLLLGRAIAAELISDDDSRDIRQPFQQLAEEFLRGCLVPARLDQNIEDIPFLIHGSPEIVALPVDRQKDLI